MLPLRFANTEEKERFRSAAESEGFNNLTAWILFHLRKQAKETLGE